MHMSDQFSLAVFLSHRSKDKAVVRPLAERLRGDGLRVWFDEWEIKPGDSIPYGSTTPGSKAPSRNSLASTGSHSG
jgi:hypothetical protein